MSRKKSAKKNSAQKNSSPLIPAAPIPAADADVVAALLDFEYTIGELDDALDAYEGTGMDRCLRAAVELRDVLGAHGWYFRPEAQLEEFLVFPSTPNPGEPGPEVSFGVEWPTNPITGIPRGVHEVMVLAPIPGGQFESTAITFRSVGEFVPFAAALKNPDPDQWPAELQERRHNPDEELEAYAERMSGRAQSS